MSTLTSLTSDRRSERRGCARVLAISLGKIGHVAEAVREYKLQLELVRKIEDDTATLRV